VVNLFRAGKSPSEIARALKKDDIHRSTIYRIVKRFKVRGEVSNLKSPGRPRTARTPKQIQSVKARIKRNPRRSIRKMAKELLISEKSVRQIVKKDLKLSSYRLQRKHYISEEVAAKRLARAKELLLKMKNGSLPGLIFSDEKLFKVEASYNRQNDRVIASSSTSIPLKKKLITRRQGSNSIMVWAAISEESRSNLVFVEPGVKINADYYKKSILEAALIPWAKKTFLDKPFTFQQDGAPAHSAKVCQAWCRSNLPGFIDKDQWPPCSPDLNPMDFGVWAMLEAEACKVQHKSIVSLKKALVKAWSTIPQEHLRACCKGFQRRLEAVVNSEGWQFE
jgi:transposase